MLPAMSNTISQALLPEFDHEMANLRRMLERVPDDNPEFRPHLKSMTLSRLAGHLIEMPSLGTFTLGQDEWHLNPPGEPPSDRYFLLKRADGLAHFDAELTRARGVLAVTTDAGMMQPWTFRKAGHKVLTMPRAAAFRGFCLSHMIHHRGQLAVYLRLLDVAVPGSYGPSADEM